MVLPLTGCANRGVGPQGGPKDTLGPVVAKMTVPDGARNVKSQEMVIQMNEYVQIAGASDQILVSPPQQRPPEIKAVGKKIEIEFKEPLKDSTTYTIEFGDQIVDNNERNPLKDYTYSFSTGDQIDSLEVYGTLINAEDLNPVSGVVVGLHQLLDDSAVYTLPFTRIGRTDKEGAFSIHNVKEGTYRLYGLMDQSRDYVFQPGEQVAFLDETVTPYIHTEVIRDTVGDSVTTLEYFYYEPSHLLLKLFTEDYQRHYFQRLLRNEAERIQLIFSAPQPSVPQLTATEIADFALHSSIEASPSMDTFTVWLKDSTVIKMDSIRLAMKYMKTDSLMQLYEQTDSLLAVYRAPMMSERTKKALAQKKEKMGLGIACNGNSRWNYFDTLLITLPTPLAHVEKDSIHLFSKQDTILTPMEMQLEKQDSLGRKLRVMAPWKPTKSYVLRVDSGAIEDIYGQVNKKNEYTLQVRSMEDYATMTVYLTPYTSKAMVQLLNSQDKPVREQRAEENGTQFTHLEAGTYYMRVYMDENGDGKWTTGDVKRHRQPEQVYYFPKKLTIRANWEFEEHWDWQAIELLKQKPAAIRKDAGEKK